MYHNFFIHSSIDGHLGCFHVVAIANSAAVNNGIHVSFSIFVSSGYTPRSGIAGSYGNSVFSFLRNFHTVLHSDCCSVAKSCLTLCDPMDCSTPGYSVHYLPEFIQLYVHWVDMLSNHLIFFCPFFCLQSFPASGSFPRGQLFASGGQSIGNSASGL